MTRTKPRLASARSTAVLGVLGLMCMLAALDTGCSSTDDAAPTTPPPGAPPGPPTASKIEHLVVIVQENHTFDTYFGRYCTAATGSNPSCTEGPACCEAAPEKDPGSDAMAGVLDDASNGGRDPDHSYGCELDEMNGGKMDQFVTSTKCGHPGNFLLADEAAVKPLWDFARGGALADRYFQPIIGQTSANDMYLARAGFVFMDNEAQTKSIGAECTYNGNKVEFTDKTVGDLLADASVPWAVYIEGYQTMLDARKDGKCPQATEECGSKLPFYPCTYDPSDIPFQYYPRFRDNPEFMRDYSQLSGELAAGKLPSVSFVKAIGYRTEHPGYKTTISAGTSFVSEVIASVQASPQASTTLVLLTYDEGGGYFDHVTPPPTNAADGKPYGTRVPMQAIGPFARKNAISHVEMEHSSIVKFIEWNWLAQKTGQLGTRDANVHNIGSLIDPAAAGIQVPED
jgi:phospholipase C